MATSCFSVGLINIRVYIMVVVFLLSQNLLAENLDDSHRIENLAYGHALFEYFQDKQLDAITHLLIAQHRAPDQNQRDEADLLLADLYYGYGLYGESHQLFSRLLNADTTTSLLNRVWFNLGRLNYERGDTQMALELLSKIDESLPEHLLDEKQYLLANLHLSQQQLEAAKHAIDIMDEQSVWYPYAIYNLGVIMLENRHLEAGEALLAEVIAMPVNTDETRALRDQANLSLALAKLRDVRPQDAIENFEQVRLQGPFSHQAMLGAGRAWNHLQQFSKALIPWLKLADINAIDAATQEALLAIPTALETSEKPKLAVQYYQLASAQFDRQLLVLDEVMAAINRNELVDILFANALLLDSTKLTATSLQSSAAPYLHLLMASNEFQRSVKQLQYLLEIQASLEHSQLNLPTLGLMLAERRQRFLDKLPLLAQSTNFDRLEAFNKARDSYAATIQYIEDNQYDITLANVVEKAQLARLDKVAINLTSIGEHQDTTEQSDKHRLLNGLLHWQITTDYAPRLRAVKKQLQEVDQSLQTSHQRSTFLRQISQGRQQHFDRYEARIVGHKTRLNEAAQRTVELILRQQKSINHLAVEAIQAQQRNLLQLRLNTRYALARLYDTLVTE